MARVCLRGAETVVNLDQDNANVFPLHRKQAR